MNLLNKRKEYLRERESVIKDLDKKYDGIIANGIWGNFTKDSKQKFYDNIIKNGCSSIRDFIIREDSEMMSYLHDTRKNDKQYNIIKEVKSINVVTTASGLVKISGFANSDVFVSLKITLLKMHPELKTEGAISDANKLILRDES